MSLFLINNNRDFYHYIHSPKIRNSNDKCKLQTDIRSDLAEPNIEVLFSKFFSCANYDAIHND